MAVKKISVTAYKVSTAEATTKAIKPFTDVAQVLIRTNSIEERFMQLSSIDGNKERDFIASFNSSTGYIFGLFLRLKEGEIAHILKNQLHQKMITLEDIAQKTEANIAGAMKDYSYFFINNVHLIYTPGHLSLKSFQTYINWLLAKYNVNEYIFTPVIQEKTEVWSDPLKL